MIEGFIVVNTALAAEAVADAALDHYRRKREQEALEERINLLNQILLAIPAKETKLHETDR
jgi:hypothetical protein